MNLPRLIFLNLMLLQSTFMFSQATHIVTAAGTAFSPASIVIQTGDTVRFINQSGLHNVNGTQVTFPDNPVSFGNEIGTGWTYTFTFDVAGDYSYRCDQHVGMGMVGEVHVTDPVSVDERSNTLNLTPYPNPAANVLTLSNDMPVMRIEIFDAKGTPVKQLLNVKTVNTEDFPAGMYFYKIQNTSGEFSGKFLKE